MTAGVGVTQVVHADPDPTLGEVREKVDDLGHRVEVATEHYHRAGEEMDEVKRRIERAERAVKKQEKEISEAVKDMAGFAAASYQTGGIDPTIRTLLADDPVAYLAEASSLDAYAKQQAEQVESVAHERRELEQAELLAEEELARRQAIEEERSAQKAKIEELLAESEDVLAQLEEEERQRLEDERRREREEAADDPSRGEDRDSGDSGDSGDEEPEPPDVPPSGKGSAAVDFALAQLGDPYVWSGEGPDTWDCSGLTMMAWRQAGVSLPRSSGSQIGVGTRVSYSQLQPGDLVFYYSPISHVAIYIGDGQIVHAPNSGEVVSIASVDLMPFSGASRPG